jgi:hypothetical protein
VSSRVDGKEVASYKKKPIELTIYRLNTTDELFYQPVQRQWHTAIRDDDYIQYSFLP